MSTRSSDAAAAPATAAISTGKNTVSMTTMTLGVSPNPVQMISSGASTTIGTVWLKVISG